MRKVKEKKSNKNHECCASTKKNIAFNLVAVLFCLIIPILIVEFVLSLISFSSGIGAGRHHKRWTEKHWRPINKLGYRDVEIEGRQNKGQIVFLGDSFTAGHGVQFKQTYYYKVRGLVGDKYQYINLGQCGSSTIHQANNLKDLVEKYNPNIKAVVHQYFGNDIEDYIKMPSYDRSAFWKIAIKVSDLASIIDHYFFIRDFSESYLTAIFSAYSDGAILRRHLRDLKRLHDRIHEMDAKLVFVTFPFLNNDEILSQSETYISLLKRYFLSNCKHGDFMLDVSPMALRIRAKERIVTAIDAHPSEFLHTKVAHTISAVISENPDSEAGLLPCLTSN